MRISLTHQRSSTEDLSIMVDLLRASTTITVALDKFKKVIPAESVSEALEISKETGGLLAGERGGETIKGFIGNSPLQIQDYNGETLILTTTNGTRILKSLKSKALIGSLINARAVARAAVELANNEIEIIMAGVNGRFAIEDFLTAGEIIYYLRDYELDEFAKAAMIAAHDKRIVDDMILNSSSALKLKKLGFFEDVKFSIQRNISKNVPIYNGKLIKKYKI
ncbi:2-phosphosulfolactate phosphatase [Methanothermobacter tenebrarum]|uniref:2-phosphosulfolactate phosphatase n=1 Tax=Methanothermobacter tenebrarum TaxID=680118 RepID=A0A328PCM7_9EURY|nr:2-phosphosulfolactate phosphatase [Methanothermobacter tenebrarum]MBC7101381.1 2-phosphosulfolactate phosphatase [Methanobacteriales archaeon]MBC7118529.1 2-phosphosulfolactate phosphatase [Methanobacteriaceae archaeon]NPV65192.1 2-phosphosulfolactate phosphatase [Methanobacteriaceae archaeon]RAO79560.1 2-phosphosulfolactate phosphatase [Methanothermobacter tenebrarum]